MELVITYWVFGVLFSWILNLINVAIERYYVSLSLSEHSVLYDVLILAFYCLIIAYVIFILIAIWRSAGKYEGESIWAWLAKAVVFLGVLGLVGGIYQGYRESTDIELALKEDLRILNQGLPHMIDEDTRLDSISLEYGNLYYNYTLVNSTVETIDVERYKTSMAAMMKTWACEDKVKRAYLEPDRSMYFLYRDKEDKPVTKITVTVKDCFE